MRTGQQKPKEKHCNSTQTTYTNAWPVKAAMNHIYRAASYSINFDSCESPGLSQFKLNTLDISLRGINVVFYHNARYQSIYCKSFRLDTSHNLLSFLFELFE